MKGKNYLGLCMRYSESCKLCPRNKKCEEELALEKRGVRYGSKSVRNKLRNNKYRRNKR